MSIEVGGRPASGERRLSAQDAIDAMRLALQSQKDDARAIGVIEELLARAPVTETDRGPQALIDLILEGALTTEIVVHE